MKLLKPIAKLHKSELCVASQKTAKKARNKKNYFEIPKPIIVTKKK